MYYTTRPGWNVETTHPVEEGQSESEPLCPAGNCITGIDPAIAFATDWGSTAFQAQTTDGDGNNHVVVVRAVEP
jgi:hypothetical protein